MDWIKKNTAYGRPWYYFFCVCVFIRLACTHFTRMEKNPNPHQPNGNPENSPSLSECATKNNNKKHWKWNGISPFFSFRHTLWLHNKSQKRTGFLRSCVCVCAGTTREFNDNRKMVFPCSYLNMLSGSERSSFVSHYVVVDNIFHLVWQAFFLFRYTYTLFVTKTFRKGNAEKKTEKKKG